jgi:hypothetical protein
MPVTTSVYIYDPVDYRIVFAKCAMLIGLRPAPGQATTAA